MKHSKNSCSVYGPLQIVHDFKFTALNVKDDYSVLDSLDYDGKLEYIRSRLDRLHLMGYSGVVMNVDYKGYLREPRAFGLFFDSAKYARSLGMRVWIYDEQYYPSGSAGGLTLEGHPELEAIGLFCVARNVRVDDTVGAIRIPSPAGCSELKYAIVAPIENGEVRHDRRTVISECKDLAGGLCFDAPTGDFRVWCFFIRPLYEGTKFSRGTRASRRYISIFNRRAVERFYKVTFEDGYAAYNEGPLGNIVDAVFTDEPYSPFYTKACKLPTRTFMPSCSVYDEPNEGIEIFPYVPWELTLPERFREKYGRPIDISLPDIFDDTPSTREARVDFYSLLSEMAIEAFPAQMAEKLGGEGVALSGHYYGEEGFDFHPIFYGDILSHLCLMEIPGCDCLWSDDRLRYSTACKLASSAAHLASRRDVMIEASNMVDKDQNITLAVAKAAVSSMFVHGITRVTSYYGENMLSEDEMREFAGYIASLGRLFDGGKYRVNTLLYYPFENLCADRYPMGIVEGNDSGEDHLGISATMTKLMKHQVLFDFINKEKLLLCELGDGYIVAPNGERIEYIVFPDIPWIDSEVAAFISEAVSLGVKILFDGEVRSVENLSFTPSFLSEGAYPAADITLFEEDPYITVMERVFDGSRLFMLMNTDTVRHSVKVKIDTDGSEELALVDPATGNRKALPTTYADGEYLPIDIPALEPVIIGKFLKDF